jgi:hypothetical protein
MTEDRQTRAARELGEAMAAADDALGDRYEHAQGRAIRAARRTRHGFQGAEMTALGMEVAARHLRHAVWATRVSQARAAEARVIAARAALDGTPCEHGWTGPWNSRPCGCGRPTD